MTAAPLSFQSVYSPVATAWLTAVAFWKAQEDASLMNPLAFVLLFHTKDSGTHSIRGSMSCPFIFKKSSEFKGRFLGLRSLAFLYCLFLVNTRNSNFRQACLHRKLSNSLGSTPYMLPYNIWKRGHFKRNKFTDIIIIPHDPSDV